MRTQLLALPDFKVKMKEELKPKKSINIFLKAQKLEIP